MTTADELLMRLRKLNVALSGANGQLIYRGPKEVLTADLRAELSERKAEILELLKDHRDAIPVEVSLQCVPRNGNLPLSFAQQRLWFLDQLEPDSAVYNVVGAWRIEGPLDSGTLRQSLEEIVRRHEALRTTFSVKDGEPVQVISPSLSLAFPVIEVDHACEEKRQEEAMRLAAKEASRPFDLRHGPVFRATLIRLANEDHVLLLAMHHIVSDGWSLGVLYRELSDLYESFVNGAPSPLADLSIQYADFAAWQRNWLSGAVLETQLSYWKKQLEGAPAVLNLPTDRPRPARQTYRGARQSFELSAELTQALKARSRNEGVTLYMTLLAVFQTLLHRYTGQDDIVIGSPIANRNRIEIEGLIGFFANTLLLRTDHSGNPTFRELLHRVRETALEAYAHQDLPFEKLVEELRPERDLSLSPLFQAMFVFQNTAGRKFNLKNLEVSPVRIAGETAKFELTLAMQEQTDRLSGSLHYNTDLFDVSTIERMVSHFQTLLKGVIANPDRPIADLPLLGEAEKRRVLIEWNNTDRDWLKDRCIHQLFEGQVKETPEAPAVISENRQLTYRELNQRANQLAHYLRSRGAGPEVLVGICVESSPEMVIGMLGILKAGAAYLPLDPKYPKARMTLIFEETGTPILLTQNHLTDRLPSYSGQVIQIDIWNDIMRESGLNLESGAGPDNLAYVIYTSGSTGKPRGVMVEHRSVVNYLSWTRELTSNVRCLPLSTSITFDASLKQVFTPLVHGKHVWILPEIVINDPVALLGSIAREEQSGLNCVPSLWSAVLDQLPQTKVESPGPRSLLVGGEPLSLDLVSRSFSAFPNLEIWNLYGPTEATANASAAKITSSCKKVTLGRPISNVRLYILDKSLEPVPIGVAGELYIGGDGLARGYRKRPDVTAEKFLPHPFSSERGARVYKTGDLARYLPDGSIEFVGRMDHQVKIRGFRIELGEIEAVLGGHPAVREALVMARKDTAEGKSGPDQRLLAYIVADTEAVPTVHELREFVKQKLPSYMVPSAFVFLDALPLSTNGKIDRKALPAPERQTVDESFRHPRSPTEIALADIWSEVLRQSEVGLDENFFDLGGHSLLAIRLMARIKNELGAELPLRILFEGPTVAQLAPKIHFKKQESMFHQREQGKYAHLFELQAGDNRKPIFCFPFRGGLDGEFFNFTRVARHFGSQYSFYGILARGLDGVSKPRRSVAEMAADYLEEIRAVQPHGPYIFVGECQGGFVAYEAARQMLADGGEMGLLVLLDTQATLPARGFWRRFALPLKYRLGKSPSWKYFKSRYVHHIQAIRQQSATAALGYSVAKLTRIVSTVPFLIGLEQSENPGRAVSEQDRLRIKLESLRRTFNLAIRRYELEPYTGRVTLLLNEQSYSANRMHDWTDYIADGLEVHKLPGAHDVCVPRHIPLVAQILKECLASLEKPG